jgi:hypothetical protein
VVSPDDWIVAGVSKNEFDEKGSYKVRCGYLITTPDACPGCRMNVNNKPRASARLGYLFQIEGMQSAGAVFSFRDLPLEDWRDLIALKSERAAFQEERIRSGK